MIDTVSMCSMFNTESSFSALLSKSEHFVLRLALEMAVDASGIMEDVATMIEVGGAGSFDVTLICCNSSTRE